ncbi:quinone-dependent dihydroorotate dehydrogenase [Candidatus Woesearchaeota archaeon]|nr:quinone-dependent dihydroorotate dehydrogenase [Candidatus Woesearchaeota archaeon]
MKEYFVWIRNKINSFLYRNVLRRIFFKVDPETMHDNVIAIGRFLGNYFFTRKLVALLYSYSDKRLEQNILGITFPNPVGLAAGFDKNAQLTDILPSVGFGFAEIGSVTGKPCEGNPKPRLWRLKKSKSLVVNYGLKSEGCKKISNQLRNKKFSIPIGISVAKTNSKETVDTDHGIKDYVIAYRAFDNIGAYTTINISCPNAFGGQPFTSARKLDMLLDKIDRISVKKPVFLKISPDLNKKEIDSIIKVSLNHNIKGFVCTNLTKNRNNKKIIDRVVPEKGGISGKVLEDKADDVIRYVYKKTRGRFIIIGCGGIFCGEDAYRKIRAGASMIQIITGMIYEGPQVVSEINRNLVTLLKKDGFNNIAEAIGTAALKQ